MTIPDHQVLLAQVATGNEEALRQLYMVFRPGLRRYLWHQLGADSCAVEDVLQETFVAIWRSAGGFRGDAKVATWIYQIARYQALHLRRRVRASDTSPQGWSDDEDNSLERAGQEPSYEDQVVDRLSLAGALSQLSWKHREALDLVFVRGFTLDEVAQILDVPVGTVKSRVSYARRALLRELETQALEEEYHHDA